jgi:hypothetical protein
LNLSFDLRPRPPQWGSEPQVNLAHIAITCEDDIFHFANECDIAQPPRISAAIQEVAARHFFNTGIHSASNKMIAAERTSKDVLRQ